MDCRWELFKIILPVLEDVTCIDLPQIHSFHIILDSTGYPIKTRQGFTSTKLQMIQAFFVPRDCQKMTKLMRRRFNVFEVFSDIKISFSDIIKIGIFDINKWFSDIKKSNSSYQKNKLFFNIKNLNLWYQKIIFFDKKNLRVLFWYQKMISWYQIFYFLISENDFFYIKNSIFDIKKSTLFSDIKNSISWYQEINFFISQIRILDIRKWFFDIQKFIFWYQVLFFNMKNSIFFYIRKWFLISENTSKILKRRLIKTSLWRQNVFVKHVQHVCISID